MKSPLPSSSSAGLQGHGGRVAWLGLRAAGAAVVKGGHFYEVSNLVRVYARLSKLTQQHTIQSATTLALGPIRAFKSEPTWSGTGDGVVRMSSGIQDFYFNFF